MLEVVGIAGIGTEGFGTDFSSWEKPFSKLGGGVSRNASFVGEASL